jgi:PhnB protein
MEPSDQFWGDRFAMLADPFGHRWMLNAPLAQS